MANGSLALRRLMEFLDENRDVFGNDITARTNVLDLAAHYPYSPERWTLKVDGTRQLLQYNDVPQYTHDVDRHVLRPAAGETVTMRSAERPRYVVQYELAATFTSALNQSLASGDRMRVGLFDGDDGYFVEQTGAHADDEVDLVMMRNGTEEYRKTDRDARVPTTEFARWKLVTGWYNITRQRWERSYAGEGQRATDADSVQYNFAIGTGDMGDQRGPRTGNLPVYYEVTASPETTGLELVAGSAAQVNLGNTTQFNRSKKTFQTDSVTVADAWEPVRAFRVDPDRKIYNMQLSNVSIGKYSANADVELLLMAADPSNVLDANGDPLADADYSVPEGANKINNVLETSGAVEQFPDATGVPQTSVQDPGGWQLARSELLSASGKSLASTASLGVDAKRPLYSRDVGVVLVKSPSTGDISYQVQTEQDW